MDLSDFIPGKKEKLTWAGATVLWDISRFKAVGIPIMDVFYAQAKDLELKAVLKAGIESQTIPQIEKLKELFKNEGLPEPLGYERKDKLNIWQSLEPNAFISDIEIARLMHEVLRYGLELISRGIAGSYRTDTRHLLWDIFQKDFNSYNQFLRMKEKKNWLYSPPSV